MLAGHPGSHADLFLPSGRGQGVGGEERGGRRGGGEHKFVSHSVVVVAEDWLYVFTSRPSGLPVGPCDFRTQRDALNEMGVSRLFGFVWLGA